MGHIQDLEANHDWLTGLNSITVGVFDFKVFESRPSRTLMSYACRPSMHCMKLNTPNDVTYSENNMDQPSNVKTTR